MNTRVLSAVSIIMGAAIVINGFLGRDLRNDVEMPMTEEQWADKTPPSKLARLFYILFGLGLFIQGVATR